MEEINAAKLTMCNSCAESMQILSVTLIFPEQSTATSSLITHPYLVLAFCLCDVVYPKMILASQHHYLCVVVVWSITIAEAEGLFSVLPCPSIDLHSSGGAAQWPGRLQIPKDSPYQFTALVKCISSRRVP